MPAFTCPNIEARKSTIAFPMPVASRTHPSSTKIGTDSRMSPDIPSSMRLMMTVRGTCVAVARYASVASPNVKAMGRPAATPRNTATTKKQEEVQLPQRDDAGAKRPEQSCEQ